MTVQRNKGLLASLISACESASIATLEAVWNAYPDIQALLKAYQYGVAQPAGGARTEERIERVLHLITSMRSGALPLRSEPANLFTGVSNES